MDIRYFLSRFWRRAHWFVLIAAAFSIAAVAVARALPPSYVSRTTLMVEGAQIADATVLVSPTVQLQLVEQRLLTRANLLAIARAQDVFPNIAAMTPDEIVAGMRAMTSIGTSAPRGGTTLMTISVTAPSGAVAAGVVNDYLTIVQQEDVQRRTVVAGQTLEFYDQEVERLSSLLDDRSAAILDFQNANADALPDALNARLSQQSSLQDRLVQTERDISTLARQREQLIRLFEANGTTLGGVAPSAAQAELDGLRAQRQRALAIFSESNPRVRLLDARIAQVESALAAEAEAALAGAPAADAGPDEGPDGAAESGAGGEGAEAGAGGEDDPLAGLPGGLPGEPPVAAGAEADPEESPERTRQRSLLDIQLTELDARAQSLQDQKADIEARLAELEDVIARIPANAIALSGLQREYANVQAQYNAAVERRSQAATGERIESLSRGQRIVVIEPPSVPSGPSGPNRLLIAGGGSAAGVGLGLALVVLLELLNQSPKRPRDITARLGVTPFATIPFVPTKAQTFRRRGIKIAIILVGILGVPAALWAVHMYYRPLDLLARDLAGMVGL